MATENYFTAIFQAIIELLTLHADLFARLGMNLFRGFAVILIAWYGIRAALSSARGGAGLNLGHFASLLLTIAFGFTMVTYYARPIPGFGVSFTHLITDQAINLANTLEVHAVQEVQTRLTAVYVGMEQPSMFDVSQVIRYYVAIFALTMAQLAVLAVIAFGYVATAVIVLIGPIFVPFFIVPHLEWLFWGWLRAFLQYAFYQVVANAFVFVFGNLILHFFDRYPPPYTFEQIAALFMPMVFLLLAFAYGVLKVPALVNAIFTGRSGDHALPSFLG
jgi:hypothetical protein